MTEVSTQTNTGFDVPPFRRLRYFHGQQLTARDFQREQEYFREKLKLRMRCLLGYGVVCGLYVEPVAPDHDDDKDDDKPKGKNDERRRKAKVKITSGLGVDCDGNELVVRGSCVVDLWEALQSDERTGNTVWVGIEYHERAVEPTRTVHNSNCADNSDCQHGWTEESYVVRVTGREPPEDERCDTCCSRCEHKVLWLARIDDVDWFEPVRDNQIHMEIRRPFSKYVPTVITGINWRHGYTYTIDEVKQLLGTQKDSGGLIVQFSDEIRVDSLQRGVVEIQVIEGGSGRNASTWYMGGEFKEPTGGEFTRHFRFRQTTRESLQDGDRVMITVRGAFILDRCCRPVDGTHVGGKVPFIRRRRDESGADVAGDWPDPGTGPDTEVGCAVPPSGIGPWTSGTGAGGDVFESWFFVTEERK
ncbi:hypothetical protein [Actinophytocola sp.]|uniref:hypothetical protein n=1 Tax=Actinophytocola sp. TaxID=1872138 RepID=UPI002ED05254